MSAARLLIIGQLVGAAAGAAVAWFLWKEKVTSGEVACSLAAGIYAGVVAAATSIQQARMDGRVSFLAAIGLQHVVSGNVEVLDEFLKGPGSYKKTDHDGVKFQYEFACRVLERLTQFPDDEVRALAGHPAARPLAAYVGTVRAVRERMRVFELKRTNEYFYPPWIVEEVAKQISMLQQAGKQLAEVNAKLSKEAN